MEDNFTVVTNELETFPTQQEEAKPTEQKGEEQEVPTSDAAPTSTEDNQAEKEPESSSETKEQDNQNHSRYQKRIDKLVGQREAAERKAQELEDKLKYYEAREETSTEKEDGKEISPLDYETYEEYEAALNEQRAKSHNPKEKKEASTNNDRDFDSAVRKLDDLFEDAREKYSDFDNLIKNPNVPITKDMVIALSELEKAGEVAYYLATNESKAKEIAQLSPYKQAIELGKIEDKLLLKPTKKVSNAPEPIDPVKPRGDVSKTDPSKMSFAEYEAYMNKQEGKKSKFW